MVSAPLLSPATDRYGSAHVLIFGEGLYLLNLFLAAGLVMSGVGSVAAWAIFFAASGAINGLLMPAQATVVQSLIKEDDLPRYLAREQAVSLSGRLIGPSIAALMLSAYAPQQSFLWVIGLWAAVWMIHGLLLLQIVRYERSCSARRLISSKTFATWMREVRDGFVTRWRLVTERWLMAQVALELFIVVPAFSMNLALIVTTMHWEPSSLGWMQTACGAGMVLANLFAVRAARTIGEWRLAQGSGYVCAAAFLLMWIAVQASSPALAGSAAFVANLALGLRIACGRAQRRVAIPREFLGRFAATHAVVNALAAQAGNAAAAASFAGLGAAAWYAIGGAVFAVAVLATPLIPGWRTLVCMTVDEAKGFYASASTLGSRRAGKV